MPWNRRINGVINALSIQPFNKACYQYYTQGRLNDTRIELNAFLAVEFLSVREPFPLTTDFAMHEFIGRLI